MGVLRDTYAVRKKLSRKNLGFRSRERERERGERERIFLFQAISL